MHVAQKLLRKRLQRPRQLHLLLAVAVVVAVTMVIHVRLILQLRVI
jgi:hypothetical protein